MYQKQFFLLFCGAILLALPSIVLAFEFCVSGTSCPNGSSFGSPFTCIPGLIGPYPERSCSSPVNPCTAEAGMECSDSCGADTFKVNDCSSECGTAKSVCVSKTTFVALSNSCSGDSRPSQCEQESASGETRIEIRNPLIFSDIEGVLGSLLKALQQIIVVLSLVFIVVGAVLYTTSAGDEGKMKVAKGAITASMIGLALGIAAPSFLKQIGDILGWGPTVNSLDPNTKTLTEIAFNTLQFLLSIVGVLGIIMLVFGGLTYITAAGDEGRSETGKKIVTYAIIGIAIALISLILVTQIANLFS